MLLSCGYCTGNLCTSFVSGNFEKTTCLVYNVTYEGKFACLGSRRKRDHYDCYRILVKYANHNVTMDTVDSGLLHIYSIQLAAYGYSKVRIFMATLALVSVKYVTKYATPLGDNGHQEMVTSIHVVKIKAIFFQPPPGFVTKPAGSFQIFSLVQ